MARHSAAAAPAFHRFDPAAGAEAEASVNHPVVVKPEPAEKSSEKLHHTPAATLKPGRRRDETGRASPDV